MKFKLNKYHKNIADWELVEDVIAVARKMDKDTLTVDEYLQYGKYHRSTFRKRFGSWFATLKKAGLEPLKGPRNTNEVSDEALFKNLATVWIKLGKQPRRREMRYPLSHHSYGAYVRRFGTWRIALEKFVAFANAEPVSSGEIENETANLLHNSRVLVLTPQQPSPKERETVNYEGGLAAAQEERLKEYGLVERDARDVSLRLRFNIFVRDGFRCLACGRSPLTEPGVKLQCDHIEPWSKGGRTIFENLRTLCAECNNGKSNMTEN